MNATMGRRLAAEAIGAYIGAAAGVGLAVLLYPSTASQDSTVALDQPPAPGSAGGRCPYLM